MTFACKSIIKDTLIALVGISQRNSRQRTGRGRGDMFDKCHLIQFLLSDFFSSIMMDGINFLSAGVVTKGRLTFSQKST